MGAISSHFQEAIFQSIQDEGENTTIITHDNQPETKNHPTTELEPQDDELEEEDYMCHDTDTHDLRAILQAYRFPYKYIMNSILGEEEEEEQEPQGPIDEDMEECEAMADEDAESSQNTPSFLNNSHVRRRRSSCIHPKSFGGNETAQSIQLEKHNPYTPETFYKLFGAI